MRYVTFTIVEDENFGDYGILPNIFRNWDNYSPAIAVGALGHDLIEHGAREYGAFHQEVAALGGFLFTRVFSGYGGEYEWTPQKRAASDLARTWNESTEAGIPEPPKVIILDKDHTELLNEFFESFRAEVDSEWTKNAVDFMYDENELPPCPYTTDKNWPKFLGWLTYGYARTVKRFKGNDYHAFRAYSNINKTIEQNWSALVQYAETGEKFTLAIDYSTGEVELRGRFI